VKHKKVLGIDIGGSGIKGAIVNTKTGELKKKRYRLETPDPATPGAVVQAISEITAHFKWNGLIGIGFPGVVQNGVVQTAANIDKQWIDENIHKIVSEACGCPVYAFNDADAAGFAEMKFGAGKKHKGVVLLITVGTGLGTVMFAEGKLVPNLELGHIILHGDDAEKYASDASRKEEDLTWEEWAARFNEYLTRLEFLTWPDLIIIGGGASKKDDKFFGYLNTRARVVPAKLQNEAGIIGAAIAAKKKYKREKK